MPQWLVIYITTTTENTNISDFNKGVCSLPSTFSSHYLSKAINISMATEQFIRTRECWHMHTYNYMYIYISHKVCIHPKEQTGIATHTKKMIVTRQVLLEYHVVKNVAFRGPKSIQTFIQTIV